MNRTRDLWFQRAILGLAGLMLLAAVALVALAITPKDEPVATVPTPTAGETVTKAPSNESNDPAVQKLAGTRMTRTITETSVQNAKPTAPPLESLIRVKGIMDYGDPKTNEAIIEDVRSGRSRTYKSGEHLKDVDAVVKQIDTAVTLEYDGKTIRMEMRSGERSEFKPMASPNQELRMALEGDSDRSP